jgi:5-methylcytosine-specific restriction endonuclease McrA
VCGERKSLENFPVDRKGRLGRKAKCKVCHTAQAKGWYADNCVRQSTLQRERYKRDRDVIREWEKIRYERDKLKRLELVVDTANRRRARIRHGGPWDRGITPGALRKRDGDNCCYCGIVMDFAPGDGRTFRATKATVEHVIPIAAGGTHTWDNVALACWQCNLRKNRTLLEDWMPAREGAESLGDDAS